MQPLRPTASADTGLSVLVVEDEPSICRAVAIALSRAGYRPVTTTTGEGALTYLRSQHFDALLLDLRIPDMRGDVIYHLAVSSQPHLRNRTLFTTGDVTEQAGELIDACGCPILMKPFDLSDLSTAVRNLITPTDVAMRREGTTGR